jgi:sugar porter (SP) family MFS transporter
MITIFWGDLIGRRKTIFLGTTFLIIGEIIQASSFSYGQFIAGRVIAGFGNGFNTATVPAWQAECTKAHRRGTLLMVSAGACIAAGVSFSYWMDFAFAWIPNSSASWRVPIAIQLIFAVAVLGLMFIMPESPRWLILSGREDEALHVLAALNDNDRDAVETRQEFLQIKDAVIEMAKGGNRDLVSMGDYRHFHRVALAFMLQVFQQMTGINLVTQYLALMFVQQFAYVRWVAMLIAACAGTSFFLASFVAVVGIDRFWGRRSLMMFGASGMCLCMVILTIMQYLNIRASLIAGTVFVFVYLAFFAIGWQGMAWLYQVEIIPLRIRGSANALSTAGNWIVNFIVVLIAPVAFHNIGYRTYIIFACT